MAMIPLILIAYALLAIYEYVPLYKQKMWADFWINLIFGVLSLSIIIMLALNIKIPSPETPIRMITTAIFGK